LPMAKQKGSKQLEFIMLSIVQKWFCQEIYVTDTRNCHWWHSLYFSVMLSMGESWNRQFYYIPVEVTTIDFGFIMQDVIW